jgi:hypothetical protein
MYEYDFSGAEGWVIRDSARLQLKIIEQIKPPVAVVLHVLRMMVVEDRDRHSDIAEDDMQSMQGSGEAWTTSFERFLGSQILIEGYLKKLDFVALSANERDAMLEGLATFAEVEVRLKLLEFALGWVDQVVEPLKTSSEAGKGNVVASDVQRICKLLAVPSKKAS